MAQWSPWRHFRDKILPDCPARRRQNTGSRSRSAPTSKRHVRSSWCRDDVRRKSGESLPDYEERSGHRTLQRSCNRPRRVGASSSNNSCPAAAAVIARCAVHLNDHLIQDRDPEPIRRSHASSRFLRRAKDLLRLILLLPTTNEIVPSDVRTSCSTHSRRQGHLISLHTSDTPPHLITDTPKPQYTILLSSDTQRNGHCRMSVIPPSRQSSVGLHPPTSFASFLLYLNILHKTYLSLPDFPICMSQTTQLILRISNAGTPGNRITKSQSGGMRWRERKKKKTCRRAKGFAVRPPTTAVARTCPAYSDGQLRLSFFGSGKSSRSSLETGRLICSDGRNWITHSRLASYVLRDIR